MERALLGWHVVACNVYKGVQCVFKQNQPAQARSKRSSCFCLLAGGVLAEASGLFLFANSSLTVRSVITAARM